MFKLLNVCLCIQLDEVEKIFNILNGTKIFDYESIPEHILMLISNFSIRMCTWLFLHTHYTYVLDQKHVIHLAL